MPVSIEAGAYWHWYISEKKLALAQSMDGRNFMKFEVPCIVFVNFAPSAQNSSSLRNDRFTLDHLETLVLE